MKFDLDTAWKDTTSLVRDNFGLLAVVAGVFYFLPYLAAMLWVPGLSELMMGQFDPNDSAMEARVNAMLADYWWALLLLSIMQTTGFLGMIALLRRRANPTVGEALKIGARGVASYLAASLLMGFAIGLAMVVLVLPGSISGLAILTVFGIIAAIIVSLYLFTKFSISPPIVAIDEELNPIKVLRRSWQLTKGNSVRLFLFYALLIVAYIVVSLVVSMVFSLVFALGGAEAQTFGQAFSSSLMNALFAILFTGVLAAVHGQLTRLRTPPAGEADGT